MTSDGQAVGEAGGGEHGDGVGARGVGDDGGAGAVRLGPVEEGVDAGDGLDAGGEARRGTSPPCGRGWRGVLAGEVAAEDVGVGLAHDVGAVLVEGQLAAALGQDRRRRRRGAGGRCRRGCRRGRRAAPLGSCPGPARPRR